MVRHWVRARNSKHSFRYRIRRQCFLAVWMLFVGNLIIIGGCYCSKPNAEKRNVFEIEEIPLICFDCCMGRRCFSLYASFETKYFPSWYVCIFSLTYAPCTIN